MAKDLIPTALYARQSLTRAGSESNTSQVEICTEAAARFGAEIVETLVEPPSTSGFKDRGRQRPRFLDLLELIRTGRVRAVMAYKSDRLSRGGGPGWAPLIEAFEQAGCNIDRAVLTPSGWLSEFEIGIRATTDREESKKLSERMLDVRAREAATGKPRVSGRPYGYSCAGARPDCVVPDCPHDGTVSVIEHEAAIIREGAERVLLGESLWSICQDFERRKVPTARGAEWKTTVLTRILTNPRNAGIRTHNGEVVAVGQWEPIFERETWERLSIALAKRPTAGKKNFGARTSPLVGYLFCTKCGGKLRTISKQYAHGKRRGYACRKGPGLGGCGSLYTLAEPIEEEVKQYVVGKLCDPKYRRRLIGLAEKQDGEAASFADQLADLEAQQEKLLDLYLDNKVSKAAYEARYEKLVAEIEAVRDRAFRGNDNAAMRDLPPDVEELACLWTDRGVGFQRQLIALVLDRVELLPGRPGRRAAAQPSRLVWHPK